MLWFLFVFFVALMALCIVIFSRRNGEHQNYPLWQFSLLILGIVLNMYFAGIILISILYS